VGGEVSGRRTKEIGAEDDGEVGDGHLVLMFVRVDSTDSREVSVRAARMLDEQTLMRVARGGTTAEMKEEEEKRNALVEVAHEEFESSVVRVGKVVDALVKTDVAQTVILDLCGTTAAKLAISSLDFLDSVRDSRK
jgi:PP-loop superfamily ATP-utilizing enzyme